jgi:hypothetical protein
MRYQVSWVSRHVFAVAVLGVAVAVVAGVFAFARPTFHPYVMPPPPNDLPYTAVAYTAADASRAFAAAGIRTRAEGPRETRSYPMQTLSNKGLTVVVTAFGNPTLVKDSGYSPYYTFVGGHWVHAPRTCNAGAANAERWRGNVRVIVSCARAGGASGAWLRRVTLALSRL